MKKLFLIIMSVLLAASLLGCTEKKAEPEIVGNDIFTDAYFDGIKQVSLMGLTAPFAGEKMGQVIDLLQDVPLTQLSDGVQAEEEGPYYLLVLEFEDGTYKTIRLSGKIIAPNSLDSAKYAVEDEAFIEELLHIFNVPVEG